MCSIYSWAIIIEKIILFKKIYFSSDEFEEKFWKSKSAESFYYIIPRNLDDPMANVFKGSMQVVIKARSKTNLSERLTSVLEVNIEKQMNIIDKSYTFLATVGSTAPFIGLFGTVWGIMNSFQSIAIPAVVAFNKFSSDSRKYSQKLESFSKRFISIV